MTITLSEESWDIIRRELPRNSELRSRVKDLKEDAMTWGEVEGEFDAQEVATLDGLALPWLEEIISSALVKG
jgi:hypothetical protein